MLAPRVNRSVPLHGDGDSLEVDRWALACTAPPAFAQEVAALRRGRRQALHGERR